MQLRFRNQVSILLLLLLLLLLFLLLLLLLLFKLQMGFYPVAVVLHPKK
jgi:hypothetical protein